MQTRLHALLAGHLRGPSQSPKPSPDKGITPGPCLNRLPVEVGVKLHRACWGRGGSGAQEPVPTWQAAKCHESSPLPSSAGGGMRGHFLGTFWAHTVPLLLLSTSLASPLSQLACRTRHTDGAEPTCSLGMKAIEKGR